MGQKFFRKAKPVWLKGKEKEKNCTAGFCLRFGGKEEAEFSIAVSGIYRVFLNGEFLGHGPARAAHGYYRVDQVILPEARLGEENILAVEAVNFCVNSFYVPGQPAFVQAELRRGGEVLGFTGENGGFLAVEPADRLRRVQRYSFQRPFIEAYRLEEGYDSWRQGRVPGPDAAAAGEGIAAGSDPACLEIEETEAKRLLERRVPWPKFRVRRAEKIIAEGNFAQGRNDRPVWHDRALFEVGETMQGYPVEELERKVSVIMDGCVTESSRSLAQGGGGQPGGPGLPQCTMGKGEFYIADLGLNATGFLGICVECPEDTHICLTFDEVLTQGDVQYNRMACVNAVSLELKKGSYLVETIQPYTCRYIKPMVLGGRVKITQLYVREYKNPAASRAEFSCQDQVLNRIFEAGRETFAQNAVDVYMDCPSRERAGWLCDSFFTGRVEMDLTGEHTVEDNFLENYALPESFENLPEGMVPMCYPSDHLDGKYIANWALWLILELYEYQMRSPGSSFTGKLEGRVRGILSFMEGLENEEGLLEDVPGWVFVEWSRANDLTDGVNFPSNMLYSASLLAAACLYGDEEYRRKGYHVRERVKALSYDGQWFCDHAVRAGEDSGMQDRERLEGICRKAAGRLVTQPAATEVCQYYAFFFRVAQEQEYPELYRRLMEEFGPERMKLGLWPQIAPANAFIGNYLRMELLSLSGRAGQLVRESREYFDYMALRTGTLWENTGDYASCDHGFASHIIHCFYRDVLGVEKIEGNKIVLRFHELELLRCRGRIPVGEGYLEVEWERQGNLVRAAVKAPDGCSVEASCADGLVLELV